jgi:hypothetical protein
MVLGIIIVTAWLGATLSLLLFPRFLPAILWCEDLTITPSIKLLFLSTRYLASML